MKKEQLKKASTALGIAGGAIITCVSFVFYFIALFNQNFGSVGLALGVLFGGLIGGIVALIMSCFAKKSKFVVGIIQLVCFVAVCIVSVLVIVAANGTDNIAALVILPFFVVPDALLLAAGICGLIPGSSEAEEAKPEEK